MASSLKNLFDALTCDSSADGCDPDWRAQVLANADPGEVVKVKGWITEKHDELTKETRARLILEGKF